VDFFGNLITGLSVACEPYNLLFCFLGVLIGTLIGVLPGLGPSATLSILLPVTFGMPATTAVIMLAGIAYGAQYGGSTTSILVNIPGETGSVMTCLDGYQMALQGRAGPALGIAAFGSFIAGTVGIIVLQILAPPLVNVALKFGAPEYFSLMIMGLIIITFLAQKSMLKALMMAGVGTFLGTVGLDTISGVPRFIFGIPDFFDGLGIVPMVMGLFGIAEIFMNLEKTIKTEISDRKISHLLPTLKDWADSKWAIARGTVIGFALGLLPGAGAVLSTFVSYAVEKMVSKNPEKFGRGAIEGVASPEAANNAAASAGFVPMLTLGIPVTPTYAILLGALMLHGIIPGPMLMTAHPDLFWGFVASMYIGNVMLLVLNLPLIGLWVRVLRVPYPILFPLILLFSLIGAYAINNSTVDVGTMLFWGVLGYLMRKFEYEPAPFIMAFVLSPMLERSLRRSLVFSDGQFIIFFTHPISLGCLILASLILVMAVFSSARKKIVDKIQDCE
jgi:putative tricarboxylic transport membrane protein